MAVDGEWFTLKVGNQNGEFRSSGVCGAKVGAALNFPCPFFLTLLAGCTVLVEGHSVSPQWRSGLICLAVPLPLSLATGGGVEAGQRN